MRKFSAPSYERHYTQNLCATVCSKNIFLLGVMCDFFSAPLSKIFEAKNQQNLRIMAHKTLHITPHEPLEKFPLMALKMYLYARSTLARLEFEILENSENFCFFRNFPLMARKSCV